jgi:BirA family transcriptional regulator, biotin operon repressor / biotin---[acetyl-CoA-carboxylase] ligase
LQELAEVTSTNTVAASLPVWSAVRADVQTAGRGRFDRPWVSDLGGLWLSAIVPCGPIDEAACELPLLAGLAVADSVAALAAQHNLPPNTRPRLRWPNDVMIGPRKLAGILVDQFTPEEAVIGIGLNVTNDPVARASSLAGTVATLRELLSPAEPPELTALAAHVLGHLRAILDQHAAQGMEPLTPRINALWGEPRPVLLDLDVREAFGDFLGVDTAGRLQLRLPDGETQFFEPYQVKHLTELKV